MPRFAQIVMSSTALFQQRREILFGHDGPLHRLRTTRQNELILN